ncbi:MAG: septation protein A [Pseudomonadota bacterium]
MLKTLIDFLPIVVFFLGYVLPGGDIYRATTALMIAMPVQLLVGYAMTRSISRMHLISTALVLVLGTATLVLKNDLFIKWKPTVIDWLFAAVFLGSQLFTGKSLIERAAGDAIELPDAIWRQLNTAWVVFFVVLGGLNLLVVYNFSEATWVNFKLFGTLGLTLVFMVLQGLWLQRHLPQEAEEES